MHWDGSWWYMGGMWLFWIVLIVLVVWLVTWLARRGGAGPGTSVGPPRESAEEILKQRYARGEIDQEEYRARLTELRR